MLFTPTLYIGLLKHIIPLAITLTSLQWEVIRNTDQILQRCPERRYLYRKIESRIRFDPRRTLEFPEVSVTFSVSSKWTDVNLQTARGQSQCPEVYTCSAKRIHLSKCRANFMLEGKTKHFLCFHAHKAITQVAWWKETCPYWTQIDCSHSHTD